MKRLFFLLLSFYIFSACGTTSIISTLDSGVPKPDTLRMRRTVETLCSPLYEGRKAGSPHDSLIASYIAGELLSEGFSPYFPDSPIIEITPLRLKTYDVLLKHDVANPIGSILIGAHYDHLGYGGKNSGSLRPDQNAIHFGADDNASGVAVALETARLLALFKDMRYNILFAAFAAEEIGLVGSKILADSLLSLDATPSLMINLDMVGRMHSDSIHNYLSIQGTGTFQQADSLFHILDSLQVQPSFIIKTTAKSGYGPSDFSSFYRTKSPVLAFTTGAHTDYHTPQDTPDKINYLGMSEIAEFIVSYINLLSKNNILPSYIETAEPEGKKMGKFKISLGCIPDFTYEGEGFCAGTVIKGRPSDKAGMKDGDIVVQMDGTPIPNIEAYMDFLSTLKKGQLINIVVKRSNQYILLEVQL